ncbi:MAG: hypothetical protein RRB13_16545 [bacterium]|nr:hypothetical protein [bacterium]
MEWISLAEGPRPEVGQEVLVIMSSPQGPRIRHVRVKMGGKIACFNESQSWALKSCLYWAAIDWPSLEP